MNFKWELSEKSCLDVMFQKKCSLPRPLLRTNSASHTIISKHANKLAIISLTVSKHCNKYLNQNYAEITLSIEWSRETLSSTEFTARSLTVFQFEITSCNFRVRQEQPMHCEDSRRNILQSNKDTFHDSML